MNKFPKIKLICNSKSIEVLKKGQNPFEGGCSSKLALFFCNIMIALKRVSTKVLGLEEFDPEVFDELIEKVIRYLISYSDK